MPAASWMNSFAPVLWNSSMYSLRSLNIFLFWYSQRPPMVSLDALHAGQDQADAVLRAVKQEVCRFLIEVAGLHPAEQGCAAHGALDDAVLDLNVADLPGRKQGFILGIH